MKSEGRQNLWLPNMAPRKGLAFCAFAALILVSSALFICLRQPCLGVVWTPTRTGHGLVIQKTAEDLNLTPGVRITRISARDGQFVSLNNLMLIEDPDQFPTYAGYNAFFEQQRHLMALYRRGTVCLTDATRTVTTINVRKGRTPGQISANFWLLNVSASLCFLIGSGVWWYRRGEPTSRLLALTAFCYFLSILCLSVYSCRELVLDPVLFRSLSAANHLFNIIWCFALLLMFTYYPSRLGNLGIVLATSLIALTVWINQTFQWYEIPVHTYYSLNYIIPYFVAVVLGYLQWRRTARQPVERATLRWFILTVWINIGLAGGLFIIPGITRSFGTIPLWVPALSILMMFICFAFGVLRYGLFNLERWWFTGWVWLVTGLVIAGFDIVLMYLLDVGFQAIWPYSILLLGWIYFPLRYWLWNRFAKPATYLLEHHLSALIQSLFESQTMDDFIEKWSALLLKVFNPLELEIREGPPASIAILNHGLVLRVPGLDGRCICHLTGNRKGTRLFGRRDEELAKSLLDLSCGVYNITSRTREVQQKGALQERERIMRDLHDDVLPKLITIKQRSPNDTISKLADAAFQSIRETIYILRYPASRPLVEIMADWRAEAAERLAAFAIELRWEPPENLDDIYLTSLQFINCRRILREAVSNILQHAAATKVLIRFNINADRFRMMVSDNGRGIPENKIKGMGTSNMRLRARALGGRIDWRNFNVKCQESSTGVTVMFAFPMHQNDEEKLINAHRSLRAQEDG